MAFHGKLQSGAEGGGTESIWSDGALLHIIKGKITSSWYANHLQLVELCCSITDIIDSTRANMRQYTKYGFVRNGYYLLIKYSIRILCERPGWLLSSQKAVWHLTIRYFRWLSLDFHLDRGRRLAYRIYWSVTPLGKWWNDANRILSPWTSAKWFNNLAALLLALSAQY